ncbi:MAG: flagellar assembly protein FliH [Alphaproteobacteria bacterium]|jgi:flagellar assembly protein FliH
MADIDDLTFEEAQLWNLPSVDDEQAKLDGTTDAFNRPKNRWKFEAPEQEEEIKPITAKEIEAIRTAAYQEGLVSGHEEGFTKGHIEGLEQGKEQGIKEGLEEGVAAGKDQYKEQVDTQMLSLATLIENVKAPSELINSEVKNELVILATSLAKAIIKTDVQQNQEILIQAINEGIKTLPVTESQYQITLHPEDIAAVNAHFGDQHVKDSGWQLIESSELERGGCHIHTNTNAVDVSIERRSEQVFTQLLLNQGLVDDPRTL